VRVVSICLVLGFAINCTGRAPTVTDLIGEWSLAETRTPLPERLMSGRLQLDADGRFNLSNVSEQLLLPADQPHQGAVSGSGSWTIGNTTGGHLEVRLVFHTITPDGLVRLPYGAPLSIQGSGSRVRLFYYVGDPDENNRVYFDRRSAPSRNR
jgi:hypothetical protein